MPGLPRDRPSLLTRTTALLGILMVLALTVLAASPDLHERLHAHDAAPGAAAHHDAAADDDGVQLGGAGVGGRRALGVGRGLGAGREGRAAGEEEEEG